MVHPAQPRVSELVGYDVSKGGPLMKKTISRKLSLHRDTIARLELRALAAPRGGAAATEEVGFISSCTQECGCSPTGCSAEVSCYNN
jgi:hypothetical protein